MTYHDGDVDVVAIPAAFLGSLEASAGIETAVSLRTNAKTGDVGERVRVGRLGMRERSLARGRPGRGGDGRRGDMRIDGRLERRSVKREGWAGGGVGALGGIR